MARLGHLFQRFWKNENVVSLRKLMAVRDLLLPSLYGWLGQAADPNLELDITIEARTRSLLVRGYNTDTKRELGFAITQQQIIDGIYKTTFGPNVLDLIKQLQSPVMERL